MSVDRRVRFLGPDNCVTAAVRSAFQNGQLVLGDGPGGTAAAALLDPPWYRDPVTKLLGVCARGCRPGALVNLIVPQGGTRPGAGEDRAEFIAVAERLTMRPTGHVGEVGYRTPLFELAVLEQQGIARLPNWRSGDVVELVAGEMPTHLSSWHAPLSAELAYQGVRLRVTSGTAQGPSALTPISDHEVFPSVSSRSPGRNLATLWTTTNRAFAVNGPLVLKALREIATCPEAVLHERFVFNEIDSPLNQSVAPRSQLIHQLVELIRRELDDACRLVGDGAWLKTATEWRS